MSRSVAEPSAILSRTHAEALIRARQFGVPRSMIDAAAERRATGHWQGACRAAGFDVGLDLGRIGRQYGRSVVRRLADDLPHLAPDLIRWHLPRNLHDGGRLRANLLIRLNDYPVGEGLDVLTLAAVTERSGLAAGERVLLTVMPGRLDRVAGWAPSPVGERDRAGPPTGAVRLRPARQYRLDPYPGTWDARAAADHQFPAPDPDADLITRRQDEGDAEAAWSAAGIPLQAASFGSARDGRSARSARHRIASAPVNLPRLTAETRRVWPDAASVALFPGGGWAIVLDGLTTGTVTARPVDSRTATHLPVLPRAAWSRPVDAELLRLGLIRPEQMHPLVAEALGGPTWPVGLDDRPTSITVACGSAVHRVVRRDEHWLAIDHTAENLSRERRFGLLGGPVCGCLQQIDALSADPELAEDVDLHLRHGQVAAARALVRRRLGPDASFADLAGAPGRSAVDILARLSQADREHRLTRAGLRPPPAPTPPPTRRRAPKPCPA